MFSFPSLGDLNWVHSIQPFLLPWGAFLWVWEGIANDILSCYDPVIVNHLEHGQPIRGYFSGNCGKAAIVLVKKEQHVSCTICVWEWCLVVHKRSDHNCQRDYCIFILEGRSCQFILLLHYKIRTLLLLLKSVLENQVAVVR